MIEDENPDGNFSYLNRRADGSRLIDVNGFMALTVKGSDAIIYSAKCHLYLYRAHPSKGNQVDFVRVSNSTDRRVKPGTQVRTNILFFHKDTRQQLTPDIGHNFTFDCNERNLETLTTYHLPADFFDVVGEVRWQPVPDYLSGFKLQKC